MTQTLHQHRWPLATSLVISGVLLVIGLATGNIAFENLGESIGVFALVTFNTGSIRRLVTRDYDDLKTRIDTLSAEADARDDAVLAGKLKYLANGKRPFKLQP